MTKNTGNYYEHKSGNERQSVYYTFTPSPLMENDFYTIDEELSSLLIEAHKALGVLEGMGLYMPDREILQDVFLYKECCYSRMIDYPDSALPFQRDGIYDMQNTSPVESILYAYKNMDAERLNVKMLESIYGMAIYGPNLNEKVCFRKNSMFITGVITNIRKYSPTAPEHISSAIKDMLEYMKRDTSDVLIKSAMVHYQFEMIHPFDCYNGIVGRMLIKRMLLEARCCAANYLSISEALCAAKNDYFDILSSTQMSGGYIRWIKFFAATVLKSARQSRVKIESYHQIVKKDEEKLRNSEQAWIKNALAVFRYWKRNMVSDITQAAKTLELSYNTVERSVRLLQSLGILKQQLSTQRNRLFMYSELLDLFSTNAYTL